MSWTERYFQMKLIGEWVGVVFLVFLLFCWIACFVLDWWETKRAKMKRRKKK